MPQRVPRDGHPQRPARAARILAACAAFAAFAGAPVLSASRYSAADEDVYMQRFEKLSAAFRTGLGLEVYEPLEAVPGATRYRPLAGAAPAQLTIAPEGIEGARAYAERNNSIAFMVWRKGRVEAAHYFKGTAAASTSASRSLAKPMTAVAVGRAIALGRIRSLDQPVADFVAEWRGDPRRGN